jgi:hypothetical protein
MTHQSCPFLSCPILGEAYKIDPSLIIGYAKSRVAELILLPSSQAGSSLKNSSGAFLYAQPN